MKGAKIETLALLRFYALSKRSVIVPTSCWHQKPIPAAVVLNMQAICVLRLFDRGMYLYEKPKKAERKKWYEDATLQPLHGHL